MFEAAVNALSQMFSPPFRRVLLKSIGLGLLVIVLIGIGLSRLFDWLATSGATWAEAGTGAHAPWQILAWLLSFAATLGIITGGVFLMPAVSAFVGTFFVDEIADEVERTHYPADAPGRALPGRPPREKALPPRAPGSPSRASPRHHQMSPSSTHSTDETPPSLERPSSIWSVSPEPSSTTNFAISTLSPNAKGSSATSTLFAAFPSASTFAFSSAVETSVPSGMIRYVTSTFPTGATPPFPSRAHGPSKPQRRHR